MKIFIIILGSFFLNLHVIAQQCDIYISEIKALSESLVVGQSTNLSFSILNDTKGSPCSFAAYSVSVYLSLPATGITFESLASPVDGKGQFFTWQYNAANHTVTGINHKPIGDQEGDKEVTVRIKATSIKSAVSTRMIGVSIVQHHEGAAFPSNYDWNDNRLTTLRIRVPQPLELVDFSAVSVECTQIEISVETKSEYNSDNLELQRSLDGKEFSTIKMFKGTNTSYNTAFKHSDSMDLLSGVKYYYRIKHINLDGSEQIFKSISVVNNCIQSEAELELYPNPAYDKVFLKLKGVQEPKNLKIQVTNSAGELLKSISSVSLVDPFELRVNDLAAGIYNVLILGKKEIASQRFIKIE